MASCCFQPWLLLLVYIRPFVCLGQITSSECLEFPFEPLGITCTWQKMVDNYRAKIIHIFFIEIWRIIILTVNNYKMDVYLVINPFAKYNGSYGHRVMIKNCILIDSCGFPTLDHHNVQLCSQGRIMVPHPNPNHEEYDIY